MSCLHEGSPEITHQVPLSKKCWVVNLWEQELISILYAEAEFKEVEPRLKFETRQYQTEENVRKQLQIIDDATYLIFPSA